MGIIKTSIDISKGIPQEVKDRIGQLDAYEGLDLTAPNNPPLTGAELQEAARDRRERFMGAIGIEPSEASDLSPRQLEKLAQEAKARRERVMFSIRLSRTSINWWKGLGKGYTGLMTKFLEEAPNHPEWVKMTVEK
ncbi:hypothetical protein FACS1894124_5180 [Spirochaetia bacterium]|nr:hypothetical protein FACS1894124_5180 [Spirochaetia bacterium]